MRGRIALLVILVAAVVLFVATLIRPRAQEPAGGGSASSTMDMVSVHVFFVPKSAPPGKECASVNAINRTVPRLSDVPRKAVEELLKGPSDSEQANGMMTSIPAGVMVQKLVIANGTALVDLSKELQTYGGGSCRVQSIRTQIEETLKQFATVKSVIISVDGRTEDILQP